MGLDPNQKRTAVAIILATLLLCALFLAQGVTSLLAAKWLPLADASATKTTGKTRVKPRDITSFEDILKRNIFDSLQGAQWPPPAEAPAQTDDEGEGETVVEGPLDPSVLPPPCQTQARLVASVYSERHPEWSFANIAAGSGPAMLYRVGGNVENHQILEIFPRSVYLKPSNGSTCSMTMFLPPEAVASAAKPAPAVAETEASEESKPAIQPIAGLSSEELAAGIEKVNESEFNIQRGLVDKILANQGELMRAARVVPHEQGGEVVGVKLYGIRRNSLFGELGLQNGDLLRTVNGYDMTSPNTALEAYAKLRSADNLTVAVQRRGRNVNVQYHIR